MLKDYLTKLVACFLMVCMTTAAFAQGADCATKEAVTPGAYTVAAVDGAPIFNGTTAAVWYSFTPAEDGYMDISACDGGADTRLIVVNLNDCVAFTDYQLYKFDVDGCGDATGGSTLDMLVTADSTYTIIWDDAQSADGFDWTLSYTPASDFPAVMAGEDCDNANAAVLGVNTVAGLTGFGSPYLDGVSAAWYSYTADADAILTAENCDSNIDSRMVVFTGADCASSVYVTDNDDACGTDGASSSASWVATMGETYYIAWDDRWSDAGFDFNLSAASTDVNVTFTVDMSQETVAAEGAQINGTFTAGMDMPMTDNGDGTWSITTVLVAGSVVEYKFKNGAAIEEDAIPGDCTVDGMVGANRGYAVPLADATVGTVCFNACEACPPACPYGDAIICETLENYDITQNLSDQSSVWGLWNASTIDGTLTTDQAFSGDVSLFLDGSDATVDPVALLGDLTAGSWVVFHYMYVPTGSGAYYNYQREEALSNWAVEVTFAVDGTGMTSRGASFTYPHDEWFLCAVLVDLDNDIATLNIADVDVDQFNWSDGDLVQLGAVNFYPAADAANAYYVDDLVMLEGPAGIPAENYCANAMDLSGLMGAGVGMPQSSGLVDNTNALSVGDPAEGADSGWTCFGEPDGAAGSPSLENTVWFTFVGDGETYYINTSDCGSDNYITDADTQMAIYSGDDCTSLVAVACNEDADGASAGDYFSGLELATEAGVTYFMMIDGFNAEAFGGGPSVGEFCIVMDQVTEPTPQVDVTLTVGTNFTVDAAGMQIAGTFTEWMDMPMTSNGDGTWSVTVAVDANSDQEYKFKNGPDGWEEQIPGDCTVDGNVGANRPLTVGDMNMEVAEVCFNYCVSCLEVGTINPAFDAAMELAPNPTKGLTTLSFNLSTAADLDITIVNTLGQTVATRTVAGATTGTANFDLSGLAAGIYMMNITNGDIMTTKRVVLQ